MLEIFLGVAGRIELQRPDSDVEGRCLGDFVVFKKRLFSPLELDRVEVFNYQLRGNHGHFALR
jgi:hypothetical protein